MAIDLRTPIAIHRDEFLESEEGKKLCDLRGLISGDDIYARNQYLRNRIEAAFIAGWNAAETERA